MLVTIHINNIINNTTLTNNRHFPNINNHKPNLNPKCSHRHRFTPLLSSNRNFSPHIHLFRQQWLLNPKTRPKSINSSNLILYITGSCFLRLSLIPKLNLSPILNLSLHNPNPFSLISSICNCLNISNLSLKYSILYLKFSILNLSLSPNLNLIHNLYKHRFNINLSLSPIIHPTLHTGLRPSKLQLVQ